MTKQAVICFLLQLIVELSKCTNIQLIRGSTVMLPCLQSERDFYEAAVSWKFNGKDLSEQQLGFATVTDKGDIFISALQFSNAGEYECLVNGTNVVVKRRYTLTVMGLFDVEVSVTEGSDVRIPCDFPSGSEVSVNAVWSKEESSGSSTKLDTEPSENESAKKVELLYPHDPDQTILLRKATMEDAGLYICSLPEKERFSVVRLFVKAAPTVRFICEGLDQTCQDESGSRTAEAVLQESLTDFTMNLFSHLTKLNPSSNVLFSPISISGLLSHLLLGASDDTRRAIQTAISVPHDFHCVHVQMKKLREKMSQSLEMASQIYYNSEMNVSRSFVNRSIQHYAAEPVKLRKTSEENVDMINSWVANKTRNKIPHLVDFVPPSTQLLALSAVSFKGAWKHKFKPKPKQDFFQKLDGDLVRILALHHPKYKATTGHVSGLNAEVAKLALTDGNSLYILLPRSNSLADLKQVESRMSLVSVRAMIEQMNQARAEPVEMTVPLIKLDDEPNMNELFRKIGLSSLFEGANLCGLHPDGRLLLDEAKHRAVLQLTEQGVEAGAVTSVSFSRTFTIFSALRPFLLLLWSDQADVPLFIGRVTSP